MPRYVLDTNLYIAADRDARRSQDLVRFTAAILPYLFLHGVVVQEILAGAIDRRREKLVERSLVAPFERRGRVIAPTYSAWKESGRIAMRLVQRKLVSPGGFGRSFMNDCLLAASCRESGLTLVTANRKDFDLIRKVRPFTCLQPWPEPGSVARGT